MTKRHGTLTPNASPNIYDMTSEFATETSNATAVLDNVDEYE